MRVAKPPAARSAGRDANDAEEIKLGRIGRRGEVASCAILSLLLGTFGLAFVTNPVANAELKPAKSGRRRPW